MFGSILYTSYIYAGAAALLRLSLRVTLKVSECFGAVLNFEYILITFPLFS